MARPSALRARLRDAFSGLFGAPKPLTTSDPAAAPGPPSGPEAQAQMQPDADLAAGLGLDPSAELREALASAVSPPREAAVAKPVEASEVQTSEPDDEVSLEFQELLDEIGAEAVDEADSALALRDVTIRELQARLAELQDMGDRLAEADKARLAAEAELERAQRDGPTTDVEALRRERYNLRRKLARRDARIERLLEQVVALRARVDERHHVAAERWRELRRLQGERRQMEHALADAQKRLAALRGPVAALLSQPPDAAGAAGAAYARVADLMGLDLDRS
ncbi:MAG: hypothetical protein AAF682_05745 [Planctomycetota bacterium]